MTTVRKLEGQLEALNQLIDEALQNSSVEAKQSALEEFNDSELIQNSERLSSYIDPRTPTISLIKFVNNVLPEKIADLQKKAHLLQIQLNAETLHTIQSVHNEDGVTASVALSEEAESRVNVIAMLKEALKPYMDKTSSRTSEYSYGNIEWGLSFFGLSGYSKTEKLNALEKFFNRLESKSAPALNEQEIAIITTGTLGDVINPLLNDEHLGDELKEILTISTGKGSQLN